jgi:hypothetical protein
MSSWKIRPNASQIVQSNGSKREDGANIPPMQPVPKSPAPSSGSGGSGNNGQSSGGSSKK